MSALITQLKTLREQVSALHAELVRYRLVVWTAGNVLGRVSGHDLMVIKPSGVSYDELTPESMIVCDLDGTVVEVIYHFTHHFNTSLVRKPSSVHLIMVKESTCTSDHYGSRWGL